MHVGPVASTFWDTRASISEIQSIGTTIRLPAEQLLADTGVASRSRSGSRRRSQGHLGAEPSSVFSHARSRVLVDRRRDIRTGDRGTSLVVDGRQSAEGWRELGEQPRGLIPGDCLDVGAAFPAIVPPPHAVALPQSPCISRPARPSRGGESIDVFQPEHSPHRRGARTVGHRHGVSPTRRRDGMATYRARRSRRPNLDAGSTRRHVRRAVALLSPIHARHLSSRP